MNRRELERIAIDANRCGLSWSEFWPTVAANVAALKLDYFARGQLVHRLVALVASGDADGQRAAGDFQPWQVDEPPAYPASDDRTIARLLWPSPETAR